MDSTNQTTASAPLGLARGMVEPTPTQRVREALMEISMNLLTEEMDEDQVEHADYEGAYNLMIRRAREALS